MVKKSDFLPPSGDFDPNAASDADSGIFGLPFTEKDSSLVYLPVPWEATISYGGGASEGPAAVLKASRQVDLFDIDVLRPYEAGLCMLDEDPTIRGWNSKARAQALKVIAAGGGVGGSPELLAARNEVNALSGRLNDWVRDETASRMRAGKLVGVLGGDHSVPFGAFQAAAGAAPGLGILHFDAHSDTRDAYEGFTWSHASIMRNALEQIPQIEKLVSVGVRDFCEEELEFCRSLGDRVRVHFDRDLALRRFEGEPWDAAARDIVSALPEQVWVSFDIDGLDPRFCPHTGTPVPGGLDFAQADHVLRTLVRAKKKIIGFDLCEIAPPTSPSREARAEQGRGSEWDANVGARMLYKLSAWTLASQGKAALR